MKKLIILFLFPLLFLSACSKTKEFELDYSEADKITIVYYNEKKELVAIVLNEAKSKNLIASLNGSYQGMDTDVDYLSDRHAYHLYFYKDGGSSYTDVFLYQKDGELRVLSPYAYDIRLPNKNLLYKVKSYIND